MLEFGWDWSSVTVTYILRSNDTISDLSFPDDNLLTGETIVGINH